ncbi:hypothetical protein [Alloactinosynnema sp. L-07]|uniref:hypothetical protein n=1 Tax=Alloactinosynnema sp. L-07 TaxID=1653480 RepID=UPI00065F05B4|nr:hypothetical protein [Alloactinosynnema sp. L-07]CRK59995.1 hypothetical protein [Alloactinosynnema sp. L-07]
MTIMLGSVALIAVAAAVLEPAFARRRLRRQEDYRLRAVVTMLRAYSGRSGPTRREWRRG